MDLITPWPLKIIFDHILLGHPLPAALSSLQGLLALGIWPALMAMVGAIAAIALLVEMFSCLHLFSTAKVGHSITDYCFYSGGGPGRWCFGLNKRTFRCVTLLKPGRMENLGQSLDIAARVSRDGLIAASARSAPGLVGEAICAARGIA